MVYFNSTEKPNRESLVKSNQCTHHSGGNTIFPLGCYQVGERVDPSNKFLMLVCGAGDVYQMAIQLFFQLTFSASTSDSTHALGLKPSRSPSAAEFSLGLCDAFPKSF